MNTNQPRPQHMTDMSCSLGGRSSNSSIAWWVRLAGGWSVSWCCWCACRGISLMMASTNLRTCSLTIPVLLEHSSLHTSPISLKWTQTPKLQRTMQLQWFTVLSFERFYEILFIFDEAIFSGGAHNVCHCRCRWICPHWGHASPERGLNIHCDQWTCNNSIFEKCVL